MKKIIFLSLFNLTLILSIYALNKNEPVKLYVVGDSTATEYSKYEYPRMGWAQELQNFFDIKKLIVLNKAIKGRSSKSFYDEKSWKYIAEKLKPGNYVFIQFGHNDEKTDDPLRFTEPFTSFKKYLKFYIDDSREKGAIPVLLTPIHRNEWKNGKIVDTHGDYIKAIIELAEETKTPLIDLSQKTKDFFEKEGEEKMNKIFFIIKPGENPKMPQGIIDNTHIQKNGADEICKLVVQGVKELDLPVKKFLKLKWKK